MKIFSLIKCILLVLAISPFVCLAYRFCKPVLIPEVQLLTDQIQGGACHYYIDCKFRVLQFSDEYKCRMSAAKCLASKCGIYVDEQGITRGFKGDTRVCPKEVQETIPTIENAIEDLLPEYDTGDGVHHYKKCLLEAIETIKGNSVSTMNCLS